MGLDMYLTAKRYINYHEKELSDTLSQYFPELNGRKVKEVSVEVMYWRKSNAIHNWFVNAIQSGHDDCEKYFVARDELTTLRNICEAVLEDPSRADELLPCKEGFLFGSTNYDELFFNDLKDTNEKLNEILENFDTRWEFEYTSSW